MGPKPHLCFFAFKTATSAPDLQASMGLSPHLWFCVFTKPQMRAVVLCMQNNVIRIRNTSLHGSKPSSVVFACKTATFGSELQVSMGPLLRLWFFAFKTATLAPELQISMGPSPHLWFCALTTA